jgi:hypothetical protein
VSDDAEAEETLAPDWRTWVAENLIDGVASEEIVTALQAQGIPAALARSEVEATLTSPLLLTVKAMRERARRFEMAMRLRRTLAEGGAEPGGVERRAGIGARELFERYWAGGEPVVLTDATAGWPAAHKWSPAFFADHYGDVEVDVCVGREADPRCDRNFVELTRRMPMRAFIERVRNAGTTNDLYLISNNRAMRAEGLRPLFDDVRPREDLFDPAAFGPGTVALWIGPAGTLTPLHHDNTNILLCQLHGRKRVTLVSPLEPSLLEGARGFYASVHCDEPAWEEQHAGVARRTVDLSPGEGLFIPAGYWHHVRSLDVSISFALLHFRRPNRFDWYRMSRDGDQR